MKCIAIHFTNNKSTALLGHGLAEKAERADRTAFALPFLALHMKGQHTAGGAT